MSRHSFIHLCGCHFSSGSGVLCTVNWVSGEPRCIQAVDLTGPLQAKLIRPAGACLIQLI